MKTSKAQIVATIGPKSAPRDILKKMLEQGLDVVRLNFSWGDLETKAAQITMIQDLERKMNRSIPIIIDLPGPRIQETEGHTYNNSLKALTDEDKKFIAFGVKHNVEYIAVSFVGNKGDIEDCKNTIREHSGTQKVIAKIERIEALKNLEEIIMATDAVMVARGDLGAEVPLEQIPFVEARIIHRAKELEKPVITATQMMLSMVNKPTPTRAEVTDVAFAILNGSDAVMLSEETAIGTYPIETIMMMEKIILEAERHMGKKETIHGLRK